jgi:hypothetical protein
MRSGRRHRILSDHTRKVFTPFPNIGIATYGVALLSERTIAGHMEEFAATAAKKGQSGRTVDEVCEDLVKYFGTALDQQARGAGSPPPGVLGFLVAGYDASGEGRIYDVLLPAPRDGPVIRHKEPSTRRPGFLFRGQRQHARRLFEGYDVDGLHRSGAKPSENVQLQLERLGYAMNDPLSLQEAVDLAVFIVRLTVDMDRLSDGTFAEPEGMPVCGGALQVLVITSSGFDWVVRPQLHVGRPGTAEAG